jgi:hypothetical protein
MLLGRSSERLLMCNESVAVVYELLGILFWEFDLEVTQRACSYDESYDHGREAVSPWWVSICVSNICEV